MFIEPILEHGHSKICFFKLYVPLKELFVPKTDLGQILLNCLYVALDLLVQILKHLHSLIVELLKLVAFVFQIQAAQMRIKELLAQNLAIHAHI